MKEQANKIWRAWKKFGFFLGNIISKIFLWIFYFTIFAFFALPARLFKDFFAPQGRHSNFFLVKQRNLTLKDFQQEF